MKVRTAGQLAEMIAADGVACRLVGDPETLVGPDVVIDSRQAGPGALFVALPGEHVDGHDYLAAAASGGASAAITSRPVDQPIVQLVCETDADEPIEAAQRGLTALARGLHAEATRAGLRTVAITGSAGKTSTKDLLAQVLAAHGPTISPVGSFNNELGTPLTACQIDDQTAFLVAEMGARAAGDIAYLCSIVPPSAAIVLNVGTAHLGEFGSQQGIAQAKGEIVEGLPADGWAVLNADDPLVDEMAARSQARIARFSLQPDAQPLADLLVRATDLLADDLDRYGFTLRVSDPAGRDETATVHLRVIGRHQVSNATAAATAALALGLPLASVASALSEATSRSKWRMELHELASGAAIINDAYNANPEAMAAALGTLAAVGERRRSRQPSARTIALLGDMLELGPDAARLHNDVGALAAELGIDEVLAIGDFASEVVAGALRGGARASVVDQDSAAGSLELNPGDVVLVKASRGLRLERVVDQLVGGEVER